MDKTNAYQLANPWSEYDDNWIRGTYYIGVMACYLATEDEAYLNQCNDLCESLKWTLPAIPPDNGGSGGNLLTCGQIMIESYMVSKKKYKIKNIISHLENPEIKNPISNPREWYWEGGRRFVDGLFTGPPALAMLYKVTKDEKYLQWMETYVWDVYGKLYDTEENLFYRDKRYFPENVEQRKNDPHREGNMQLTASGKKVIWSRGNGWAIAGIARILEYLPKEHASYKRYEQLLQRMAQALKECQSEEGFWYPNLADPDDVHLKETSGTSFFLYGLAYGVNNGLLDKDEFTPVIRKGWKSVCDAVSAEGKVQWGQLVGDRPINLSADDSHEYVTGTFLLAASEIYKMNLKNE
ncbi:glycoside hydrolase family 88 protein [Mariniflexile sp. HNIBRBA6329]